ncbi:MAG: nuclear transport factor 2 family protein [Gemmatimonadetes bacterium]|nr:nuclear transport factor 2 family protein [Gemmatimonadota bacterium]
MTKIANSRVGLLLLAVACQPGGGPQALPNDPAEITAIEGVLTRWYTAINAHDSAGVAAPLLPSFFIFEDTTRIDRDGLVQGIVSGFEAGSQTAAMSGFETQVRGNLAWTSFRNDEVWTPKTGSPDSLHFLETVVFEKRNGQWMMERYHATKLNR